MSSGCSAMDASSSCTPEADSLWSPPELFSASVVEFGWTSQRFGCGAVTVLNKVDVKIELDKLRDILSRTCRRKI